MRDVNEAWRVLGDARRRRAYDAGDHAPSGTRYYADTTLGRERTFDDLDDEFDEAYTDVAPAGPWRVLHALPWLFVVGGLVLIFVFTAYARNDDSTRDSPGASTSGPAAGTPALGDCVQVVGTRANPVDCRQPNDGQVVLVPSPGGPCPPDTSRLQLASGDVICLAR